MSDNEITIGQLTEQLNQKVDLPTGVSQDTMDYVIEWKTPTANDPTWFRKYKSGWVEQGGRITMTDSTNQTISFLKTMFDTNYTWNIHGIRTGGNDNYAWQCGIYSTYTTTSFQIRNSSNGTMTICWEVKGQGA